MLLVLDLFAKYMYQVCPICRKIFDDDGSGCPHCGSKPKSQYNNYTTKAYFDRPSRGTRSERNSETTRINRLWKKTRQKY
jgi:hypothetical protein